jgi:hypothetical protein
MDCVARASAALEDQRDPAVRESKWAFVERLELNAVDRSLDRRAGDLDDKRVRGLEGPSEGALSKYVHRLVHNAHEAQAIRPHSSTA